MSNSRRLPRPSLALVVALLALVVATGGTSYAAVTLAKNSVLSKHIKNGQVKTADLKDGAVTGAKVTDGSLAAGDFAAGPVNTVTVVASSGSIANNSFGSATAQCPAGMEAIGGGPDLQNVLTMYVTSSAPLVDNTNAYSLSNGQHGPATAWRAFARNETGSPANFKVVAVCAG